MDLIKLFQRIELFEGLTSSEIYKIIDLCQQHTYKKGDLLTIEGESGEEFHIIIQGLVEVFLDKQNSSPRVVVNLGEGQLIGEMSLVDRGLRSASVRVIQEPTIVESIRNEDFKYLCEQDNRIGYVVMQNLAADLSFKLRHRHLSENRF